MVSYDVNDQDYSTPDKFTQEITGLNYGKTVTIQYYLTTTCSNRQTDVILPYNYDTTKTYPVLYLLHGMGSNLCREACIDYDIELTKAKIDHIFLKCQEDMKEVCGRLDFITL